jgi:transposase
VIGYETKDLINYIPPVFEIIEQAREILACTCLDSTITTAPLPLHILPKVGATEEFLASLIVGKMVDRQPLYHLEKQLHDRYHVDVSRKTMSYWLIDLVEPLQPLYNLLKDCIIDYDIASCDATTLQVLHEPGRDPHTKSYMYCMCGGTEEHPVVLYAYNDKLHKQFVADWFSGFEGYLHIDCDEFFEIVVDNITVFASFCNAHGRRKFENITKQSKNRGLSHEAMDFYKRLYKIERFAKDNNLSLIEIYYLRQKESKPIMDEFKQWLETNVSTILPKSPLGKAFAYVLNHWDGFISFLYDPRLSIDNNHTEREIKPIVMARKTFLFANSVAGAHALAMHFSITRTAIANKLEPYQYYVHVLKKIPHCKTTEDFEKLLPWNVTLPKITQDPPDDVSALSEDSS